MSGETKIFFTGKKTRLTATETLEGCSSIVRIEKLAGIDAFGSQQWVVIDDPHPQLVEVVAELYEEKLVSQWAILSSEDIFKGNIPMLSEDKDKLEKILDNLATTTAEALKKRKGGISGIEYHLVHFLEILTEKPRITFLKLMSLNIMESMAKHPAFESYTTTILDVVLSK